PPTSRIVRVLTAPVALVLIVVMPPVIALARYRVSHVPFAPKLAPGPVILHINIREVVGWGEVRAVADRGSCNQNRVAARGRGVKRAGGRIAALGLNDCNRCAPPRCPQKHG